MGKRFTELDDDLRAFIARQHVFFVATAPLAADGHMNVSPKGLDTFRVLGPTTVAYLDLTGSGVETVAHLRENGRITVMFCAFEGRPRILRLYGRGRCVEPPAPPNTLVVALGIGEDGVDFNFGELSPADPFGFVFVDQNQNGLRDPGEPGIPGVAVTVSGTAFAGSVLAPPLVAADLPSGNLTTFTDANGRWEFPIVPPGLYSFVETQPSGFRDGLEQNADPNPPFTVVVGNDRFDNVELSPFPIRGPFNFGEILPSVPVTPVTPPMGPGVINKAMFLSSTPGAADMFVPTSPQFTNSVARLGIVSPIRSIGVAVGSDAGQLGIARLFDFATATERVTVVPFGGFLGGVRVAAGDINGDGIDDLIATMGPGGLPIVLVFDGNTGALMSGFFALPPGFTSGLNVTAGDVNGDGRAEVIVGTATGTAIVAVYDGLTGGLLSAFLPFGGLPVGVTVAAGDVNGDGRADIVTGAASGLPMVFVYDGATNAQLSAFFAFPPVLGSGVNVAVADVFGTGRAQVVATLASVPVPVVATFNLDGTMTSSVMAPNSGNGMRVSTADINGDGASDLVLGAGQGSTRVNIMSGRDFALLDDFYGISPFGLSGVFVG